MAQCRKIGGCPTGQAVITTGGNLQAKYVIHTVGPIYRGGTRNETKLLQKRLSRKPENWPCKITCKGISFPAISAGVYGYPMDEAAHLALKTCIDFSHENTGIKTHPSYFICPADL